MISLLKKIRREYFPNRLEKIADRIRNSYFNGSYEDKAELLPTILEIAEDYNNKVRNLDKSRVRIITKTRIEVDYQHGMECNTEVTDILKQNIKLFKLNEANKNRVIKVHKKSNLKIIKAYAAK